MKNINAVLSALLAAVFYAVNVPLSKLLLRDVGPAMMAALLSFQGADSLRFSGGSLFVLLAAACWGFENNCTRMISSKSTYEIVVLKGVFSGSGSLAIALARGEALPALPPAAAALLLGFVAYGLSIFLYVRAQSALGAAKTSA